FAMEDVATGKAEARFEIGRRKDLTRLDSVWQVRCEAGERGDDAVRGRLALSDRPRAIAAIVREILREDREQMLAGRRDRRIGRRLHVAFDQRRARDAAGNGVFVRGLQVLDGVRHVYRSAVVRLRVRAWAARVVRQFA